MGAITRRVFLKRTISSVGGIMLAKSFGPSVGLAQLPGDMSRVVVVEHSEATDGVKVINAANVQTMMDESIKQLTGEATVVDAWASLLPDFKKDHIVAIKVNCATGMLPTHPEVVDTIISGLTAAGVPENNIIVYDIVKWCLAPCGYKFNMTDVGVRYFAAMKTENQEEDGWGPDRDKPVDILGRKIFLSTILTRCDHLINVPVLKGHGFGFTLSLKNHFGSLAVHPNVLHNNINMAIAVLNDQEDIRDKTRLIVTDALFGCWRGNLLPPDFVANSLIVSTDPVATDYVGSEMINEERARLNMGPRNMDFMLNKAAELGLGTNDPEKMELVKLELGAQEKPEEEEPEEEVKKAVNPARSYKTQWGNIKK